MPKLDPGCWILDAGCWILVSSRKKENDGIMKEQQKSEDRRQMTPKASGQPLFELCPLAFI
jgi:hypothetical protein